MIAIAGLALGACEGGSGDSVDATPDDAVRGDVSVVVEVSDDQPTVERSVVVFNDRAGVVLDVGFLDENGRATGEVTAGGSVSVIWPASYRTDITTVLDVSPGDEIRFAFVLPMESLVGYVEVEFPLDPTAEQHGVRLCGGTIGVQPGQNSVSMGLIPSCTTELVDVTVFSFRSGGEPKYLTSPNRFAMPGGMLLIAGDYSPFETFTATLRDLPSDVGRATASMMLFDDGRFLTGHGGTFQAPVSGVVTSELRYAPAGDTMSVRSLYELAGTQVSQQIEEWIPSNANYETTPTLLPWVLGGTVDPDAGTVEISTQGDGPADVAYVEFSTGAGAGVALVWAIIGPGTERILTIPELPPPYDQLRPTDDEPFPYVSAALFTIDGAGGYPAVRSAFFDVMGRYRRNWDGATFGMSGGGPYW